MDNPSFISKSVLINFDDKRVSLLSDMPFLEVKKLIQTLSLAYNWNEDEIILDIYNPYRR